MKYKCLYIGILLIGIIFQYGKVYPQSSADNTILFDSDFFEKEEPFEITLEFDAKKYSSEKKDERYIPVILKHYDSDSLLISSKVKLFVYPALRGEQKAITTCDSFDPPKHLKYLFKHFMENKQIIDLKDAKRENLNIISDQVLEMIKEGKSGWEDLVPRKVSEAIKTNHFFSYPHQLEQDEEA